MSVTDQIIDVLFLPLAVVGGTLVLILFLVLRNTAQLMLMGRRQRLLLALLEEGGTAPRQKSAKPAPPPSQSATDPSDAEPLLLDRPAPETLTPAPRTGRSARAVASEPESPALRPAPDDFHRHRMAASVPAAKETRPSGPQPQRRSQPGAPSGLPPEADIPATERVRSDGPIEPITVRSDAELGVVYSFRGKDYLSRIAADQARWRALNQSDGTLHARASAIHGPAQGRFG